MRASYEENGLVSAANLRTGEGTTNRPITKLYTLELAQNDVSLDTQAKQEADNFKTVTST